MLVSSHDVCAHSCTQAVVLRVVGDLDNHATQGWPGQKPGARGGMLLEREAQAICNATPCACSFRGACVKVTRQLTLRADFAFLVTLASGT